AAHDAAPLAGAVRASGALTQRDLPRPRGGCRRLRALAHVGLFARRPCSRGTTSWPPWITRPLGSTYTDTEAFPAIVCGRSSVATLTVLGPSTTTSCASR